MTDPNKIGRPEDFELRDLGPEPKHLVTYMVAPAFAKRSLIKDEPGSDCSRTFGL